MFRVTNGIKGLAASLAPEPTLIVRPAAAAAGVPAPRLGTPVMLPGSTLEIPPLPSMKNGVLIGVPLTPAAQIGVEPTDEPVGMTKAPGKGISNM